MIIALLSVLILTGIVWILNKKLPVKICSICAGVSLTWFWMFLGMLLGKLLVADYQVPTAILAGGTMVGLMSKLEESIKVKFVLIWKTIFVLSGFAAVYGLITNQWTILIIGIIVDIIATTVFKTHKTEKENSDFKRLKELKEKMKNCC
ncbi:hypothetical protein A3B85_00600 [Candidatus Nomurabacteria bacterium RIFCSPHIGHO2_02_FULL_37_13]|uniref:Uncharacterized protein n=1 Tax=Candidatus Nomurabacteria bacterium RIFCSPHIGHO2_02_FULL_37_13 TaxID=1801750 RepID=A0A1F6W6C6_9BACT|nr:MAG: hypothetical protein A2640_02740 [Candidatus Nomurabacteria bacterium RIFCSPHIGHO2_01_FULL_36_23]OGI77459.1 MAG: hypothetical protein A3B85_00600 [Candidatus Nomurabacteria bacterium RIFCSPHIGHO2_02_FULL_37_13]OGI87530.1 MAG: hypothetical protein A2906_01075 [Candidatus Nomurabacteria bacterium RIFCSPLOWO2_01_FULL_37_25]